MFLLFFSSDNMTKSGVKRHKPNQTPTKTSFFLYFTDYMCHVMVSVLVCKTSLKPIYYPRSCHVIILAWGRLKMWELGYCSLFLFLWVPNYSLKLFWWCGFALFFISYRYWDKPGKSKSINSAGKCCTTIIPGSCFH